jgi:hypothetical protein
MKREDSKISLGFDNKTYPAGTHMCLIYNDETERRKKLYQNFWTAV